MSPRWLVIAPLTLNSWGHAATPPCAANAAGACPLDDEEVNLLQYGVGRHAEAIGVEMRSLDAGQTLAQGLVDAVYTYGAPATHNEAFRNAAAQDGCFPGLRSYTENVLGVGGSIRQVDAAAVNNYFLHARTSTLVLRRGMNSTYTPCRPPQQDGHPDWPKRGAPQVYEEWRIHRQNNYQDRFDEMTIGGKELVNEEPFKTAREFVLLAWKAYDPVATTKRELAEKMPDWKLVGREVYETHDDQDPVLVVQQAGSLDCALVFCGSNNAADYPSSTTKYKTGYCGFEGVHVGYRNELWTITKTLWPKLRPALEQCNKVAVVGHSLGGALAELFSACANSGNTTDPDFQLLAWDRSKAPKQMLEIEG